MDFNRRNFLKGISLTAFAGAASPRLIAEGTTLALPEMSNGRLKPGGKRLVYTHVDMPMVAIADFAEKGKTDPFYAELDRLCSESNGLWCKAAEDYLLANAPKISIGEPTAKIVERQIRL